MSFTLSKFMQTNGVMTTFSSMSQVYKANQAESYKYPLTIPFQLQSSKYKYEIRVYKPCFWDLEFIKHDRHRNTGDHIVYRVGMDCNAFEKILF